MPSDGTAATVSVVRKSPYPLLVILFPSRKYRTIWFPDPSTKNCIWTSFAVLRLMSPLPAVIVELKSVVPTRKGGSATESNAVWNWTETPDSGG